MVGICYKNVTFKEKIGEFNLETKFIGLDGFDEIEPIPSVRYNPKKSKNQKPQHASYTVREHKIVKKKVVLAAVTAMTAALLSCVTVAGALNANGGGNNEPTEPSVPAIVSTADETNTAATADEAESKLYGLYIDDELVGVTPDKQQLEKALKKVLDDYKEGYDAQTTTEFANKVEVRELDENDDKTLTASELVALGMDKFSINLATDYIYKEETEYETNITYDDSKPASYREVTKEGKNGVTEWTVRYTFTDGEITDSEVTGSKVTQEVQNEEVTVGTAEETEDSDSGDDYTGDTSYDSDSDSDNSSDYTTGSSGSFIWPLPHTHNLTSYFEWRWGRMHNGIDIAGGDDYGQPIIAADSGTVTWSGNDGGGYGNYVVIDHGNGYTTIYGHASELNCSTGDYVSQGQTIAFVGSTGNSTGPHLHFEIRVNDEPVDPLGYVS